MTKSDELGFDKDNSPGSRESYARRRQRHQARLRKVVAKRDPTCVGCGTLENLQAAHLIPVAELINDVDLEAAHDPRIAASLCQRCHLIFDGTQELLPEDSAELDRLYDARYCRAVELLREEPDRMDIERLTRSDEGIRRIGGQMKSLFDKTRALRHEIRIRVIKHMGRTVLQEEAPSQEDNFRSWCFDVEQRIFELIFSDFTSRCRFFEIRKEDKEIAHGAGMHYSRRLRLWYSSTTENLQFIDQDERAKKVTDVAGWERSLRESEQRCREEKQCALQEKAEKEKDAKKAVQQAILVSMSTEPTTIRNIANAIGLSYGQVNNEMYPNSLSLYAQGLVERHRGHGGRRSAIAYSLTAKGLLLVTTIKSEKTMLR